MVDIPLSGCCEQERELQARRATQLRVLQRHDRATNAVLRKQHTIIQHEPIHQYSSIGACCTGGTHHTSEEEELKKVDDEPQSDDDSDDEFLDEFERSMRLRRQAELASRAELVAQGRGQVRAFSSTSSFLEYYSTSNECPYQVIYFSTFGPQQEQCHSSSSSSSSSMKTTLGSWEERVAQSMTRALEQLARVFLGTAMSTVSIDASMWSRHEAQLSHLGFLTRVEQVPCIVAVVPSGGGGDNVPNIQRIEWTTKRQKELMENDHQLDVVLGSWLEQCQVLHVQSSSERKMEKKTLTEEEEEEEEERKVYCERDGCRLRHLYLHEHVSSKDEIKKTIAAWRTT